MDKPGFDSVLLPLSSIDNQLQTHLDLERMRACSILYSIPAPNVCSSVLLLSGWGVEEDEVGFEPSTIVAIALPVRPPHFCNSHICQSTKLFSACRDSENFEFLNGPENLCFSPQMSNKKIFFKKLSPQIKSD